MWKTLKINDIVWWVVDEFDGYSKHKGVVSKVCHDHVIVSADGMSLWVDDDTEYMFIKN